MDRDLNDTFSRSVEEGVSRLTRSVPSLLATGAVGGIDVTMGVFAMLIVKDQTGNDLLAAVAFTIGFVALTLANSELFTENFLVPIAAIAAKDAPWWSLPRLWVGTFITNLVGGWIAIALVLTALPSLRNVALEVGTRSSHQGIGGRMFAGAVLAGLVVTLMTWMERANDSAVAKIVSALTMAFLLAAGPLDHSVVGSIEMFGALQVGAPFGYLDLLRMLSWMALGNLIGGIGLVTTLRLVQVGSRQIHLEQRTPASEHR